MNPDNEKTIWVAAQSSGAELGTREHPFADVGRAVKKAQPGQHVVLKKGVYRGDITIDRSGTRDYPVCIRGEDAGVEIAGSCWYLYDTCDLAVSDLTFRDSPRGALCVVGACRRNSFSRLSFVDCGFSGDDSCTLFFGGSGARCNIVETCRFIRDERLRPKRADRKAASVAIMIAEGDDDGGEANVDFVVRRTRIDNYDYGVLVGSRDRTTGQYGHIVEYNTVDNCAMDGIGVKCGDTIVRNNRVRNTGGIAIAVAAGTSSHIMSNRIVGCDQGIVVCGREHTVSGNCIVASQTHALHVAGTLRPDVAAAGAVFIERNTLVPGGFSQQSSAPGIRIDRGTSCVVEKNLFCGTGKFCESNEREPRIPGTGCYMHDNRGCGGALPLDGCEVADVFFAAREEGDFSNDSGYGADGWVLGLSPPQPDEFAAGYDNVTLNSDDDDSAAGEMRARAVDALLFSQDMNFEDGQ